MKVVSSVLAGGLLVVLLGPSARLQAAERMTPGQWEFTMTTKGASHSSKYCVDTDLAAVANGDSRSGREAADWAPAPNEADAALAGRARNRRVELTRQ